MGFNDKTNNMNKKTRWDSMIKQITSEGSEPEVNPPLELLAYLALETFTNEPTKYTLPLARWKAESEGDFVDFRKLLLFFVLHFLKIIEFKFAHEVCIIK